MAKKWVVEVLAPGALEGHRTGSIIKDPDKDLLARAQNPKNRMLKAYQIDEGEAEKKKVVKTRTAEPCPG
jgi:hypothetical protein